MSRWFRLVSVKLMKERESAAATTTPETSKKSAKSPMEHDDAKTKRKPTKEERLGVGRA